MKETQITSCLAIVTGLLMGMASCGYNASNNDDESYTLNVRSVIDNPTETHYLSELTDELEYIQLETTPSCFLSFIQWFDISGDYILVSDYKGLYQFNKSGGFIREIGRKGNGPGEHNGRIRFASDKQQNEVYIYNWPQGQVNVHDLETGLFKRSFTIDFCRYIDNLVIMPGGEIAFFITDIPSDLNEVIITDREGNIIANIPNMLKALIKGHVSGPASVFSLNDIVYYKYQYRDTLYSLNAQFERNPYALFTPENNESHNDFEIWPNPEISIHYPDYISIPRLLINDHFIFTTLQKGISTSIHDQLYIRTLYDKSTKELTPTEGFTNNIDGGMTFWPRWIAEDVMIDYYQPFQLLEYYQETKGKIEHSDAFIQLVSQLNENDNPVLVLTKQQ